MFTLEIMSSLYDNCRHKAVSYYRKITDTANSFICYNGNQIDDRGNADGACSQTHQEMPSQKVVESEFNNFVNTLNLPEPNRGAMKSLPLDKKWNILQQRKNCAYFFAEHPRQYIVLLNNVILSENKIHNNGLSLETISALEALHISIRTQSQNYVEQFIAEDGIKCLVKFLTKFHVRASSLYDNAITLILNIVKSILNIKLGENAVLNDGNLLKMLILFSGTNFGKGKVLALQILAGICLLENGWKKVMISFGEAYSILGEHGQFQRLVLQLTEKHYPEKLDFSIKISTMSLINVLLNSGEAKDNIEQRLRLRKQFVGLGLEKIIDSLRHYEHPLLHDHLDLFEMMKMEDEEIFLKQLNEPHFDATNPLAIVGVLENRLKISSVSFSSFLSLLQSFTLISADKRGELIWKLCNSFVENLVFQSIENADTKTVHEIVSDQIKESRNMVDSETNSNTCMSANRANSHHELTDQINRTEYCLKQIVNETAVVDENFSTKIASEYFPKAESDILPNQPVAKINQIAVQQTYTSAKMAIVHPFPSQTCAVAPPAPPPLPPQFFQSSAKPCTTLKKSFSKGSNNLKSLNWITVQSVQLEGTVWSDFKSTEIDQFLDAELLDKNFSVQNKTKRDSIADGGMSKCFSVLERRRAQNFQILLTKLKIPNEEISRLILTLDENNLLHKDMVDQMLKFIPTKEEIQKLNELEVYSSLNQVDQFFLLSTKIPRYEQRLKCLWISKVFKEKSSDFKLQVDAVTKASNILRASKRIKKLMQIILAIGNRMNDGKHNGDAVAFHISSLANLSDVKSSQKPDYTLIHYLVECCELKFPEVFRLKRELLATTEASKVSSLEMDAELSALRTSLKLVENELNRKDVDNAFFTKMTSFLNDSLKTLTELQDFFKEMNSAYKLCLHTFAITSTTKAINPGECFGLFSRFLSSLLNIRRCMKLEKENQEKRMETLNKTRMKNLTLSNKILKTHGDNAFNAVDGNREDRFKNKKSSDFEYLISALQNGEMFLDDLQRLRSSFRRNPHQTRKNRISKSTERSETESRER